jgi:predicted AAA+ superfamily ATPase
MEYPRALDLRPTLVQKSCFLFGPRQTGKTSLLRKEFPEAPRYSLLENDTWLRLSANPSILRDELNRRGELVIIDEIQKLPQLLDEVHWLIEERKIRFVLTGSSARKLRRGGVNLLGGRARSRTLHPFVVPELGEDFELLKALNHGTLPSIYLSDSPSEDLAAYAGDYLREEIVAEGLTRNVPAFSRFLQVAAACNGQILNFASVSSDAQVPKTTVQDYFQILRDTLIGHDLPPFRETLKRKPTATAKFFLFDVGVTRYLQNAAPLKMRSPDFGAAFESYIFHELRAFIDYKVPGGNLSYWRSSTGFEVDFILNGEIAIEVKGKSVVGTRDLKGIQALREEGMMKRYIVVCLEARERTTDGIQILPFKRFIERLWANEL